ncbi:hypothetical protein DB346_02560 [Verrucomicrobia bacterium LW23]|nr:hypothetical protein DB346_04095 [Verrucomicrobia bacterium LW23]PTY04330.1 hypothetical protein DB346_02560 [Verrucomicrobia bacterium LW23]
MAFGESKRYKGHLTVGKGYSFFTELDNSKSYWNTGMPRSPQSVARQLKAFRKPYLSGIFATGGWAMYIDCTGYLMYRREADGRVWEDLHVTEIHEVGQPKAEFRRARNLPPAREDIRPGM